VVARLLNGHFQTHPLRKIQNETTGYSLQTRVGNGGKCAAEAGERLDNERHQVRSAIIRHSQGSLTVHALNKISTDVAALADDLGELAMSLLVDSRGN